MAEILTAIVGLLDAASKIKEYVLNPIKAHFNCLFHYSNIIQGLRDKDRELKRTTDHLQQQIEAAKDKGDNILPHVEEWCSRVKELKEKINRILGDEPRVTACPNLRLRHSRSREAEKLTADIVELLSEHLKFGGHISDPAPLRGMETIDTKSPISEFDSRKRKEEEIMSYLRDHSISRIGVWGMGGVGKTTMAKKIGKMAFEERLFDKTVMAVVSQQVDPLKIQQQLAEGLDLKFTQETVPIRASQLHTRLTTRKDEKDEKVLIILDDVWEWLDLGKLGIPSQTKILLTTRDHDVCRMMSQGATQILTLGVLEEGEAWSLFCQNVGDVVNHSNLRPLAMSVAKECKSLPLALVTVGRSLKDVEDVSTWKHFLSQLQKAAPEYIPGYLRDVFQSLEVSYKHLETDEARYLFLLCSLFPEDSEIEIENLVRLGVGLNIFSAIDSIYEARNKVNCIIKKLIDRCLLMDAGTKSWHTYVKMHDVIRDMALFIVSSGKHVFMAKHDKGLREWLKKDSREGSTHILLTLTESMSIPEPINCPRLDSLLMIFDFLPRKPKLPIGLFHGVANLISLSIYGEHIFSDGEAVVCPLSLSFLPSLTKLRVLHLHKCFLEEISFIGQLVNLEILSCRGSDIQELPSVIGFLTKLTLLDLTNCTKLKNIAPGVISKLVQLEELRLMNCPIEWECKDTGNYKSNASLAEVFSLENLRLLEVSVQDLQVISQKMDYLENLTSYSIAIVQECYVYRFRQYKFVLEGSYTDLKRVSVRADKTRVFSDAISMLVKGVEELKLGGNGCKCITELLGREGFENLKSLEIFSLDDVKILVEPMHRGIFPILRHLQLTSMRDLEEICYGHPPVGSFSELQALSLEKLDKLMYFCKCPNQKLSLSQLTKVSIQKCAKLKWVFPLSVAESLCQLQSIEVINCPIIEVVFKNEEGSESGITTINPIKFPNLAAMRFSNLPMLVTLFEAVDAVIEFPSMKTLNISGVSPNFKIFPNQSVQIFYHEVSSGFFFGLVELHIESHHGLRILFSPAVFRGLINLRILIVKDCIALEDIVGLEEGEAIVEQCSKVLSIPRLYKLQLSGLPKLRYFCPFWNALELPSLEMVKITDCPMMETFAVDQYSGGNNSMPSSLIPKFFFSKQVTCPKLEILKLEGLKMSSLLFSPEIPIASLGALCELVIQSCRNLKSLFTYRMVGGLTSLWLLKVGKCSMFEQVIAKDEEEDVDDDEMLVRIMPKLRYLILEKLPNLHGFSHRLRDLQLPSLDVIHLDDDTEMRKSTFSSGPVRLRTGTRVHGISDPEFASQFFFHTQQHQDEDSVDNDCCFMLLPGELSFSYSDSDSAVIPSVVKGESDVFFLHGWKKVEGKFDMEKLSPEITYEIAFVIMLVDMYSDDDSLETILADDKRKHKMKDMPKKQWKEILAGELRPSSGHHGEITFFLRKWIRGSQTCVALKGVSIRPKGDVA